LSIKKAATLNFVSALSGFIGLYIGIGIGDEYSKRWILAVTAGIFLYVALTDMVIIIFILFHNLFRNKLSNITI
jgi:zinc transporter ZupT